MGDLSEAEAYEIREVWSDNLDHEIKLIRDIVDEYNYIAMDTEYPGAIVATLFAGTGILMDPKAYINLKNNVNITKLIQLGLTFSDENGNLPPCGTEGRYCVWQFNFREFIVDEDIRNDEAIQLLRDSGIDFQKFADKGVDASRFAEILTPSGAVMNDSVHWVLFQGGYDIGYLTKLLSGRDLPDTIEKFILRVKRYFPSFYDMKYLMTKCNDHLHGGLSDVAARLGVERIGVSHQAGSDSLLTSCTFMKMKQDYFDGSPPKQYAGVLSGFI